MSFCGSPSPCGMNRLASSRVNTVRSAAVYRLRSSPAASDDTLERSAPALAGTSGKVTDFSPVLIGLPEADRSQQPVGKLRPEPLPECLGQVFCGRDAPLQPWNVGVQVAVIHVADDLRADDVGQRFQVKDVTSGLMDLAGHNYLKDVVVPVQIRALPEQAPVLLVGQIRVVELVRGIEGFTAADQDGHQPRPLSIAFPNDRLHE